MIRFAAIVLLCTAFLLPAETVNAPAPELEIRMETGQVIKLSQLKGKPVLMQFFSTTCPHCQKSAAAMEKIVRTYVPKGLQVLAVTTDESQLKEFPEFRRKYGATYKMGLVYRDDSYRFFNLSVMRPFYVPSFAFIDKAGIMKERFIGGLHVEGVDAEFAAMAKYIDPLLTPVPAKSSTPARPAATQAKR
jgi:peroxiredoxin